MKLIVGLGNPEKQYDMTRHNIGFMVVDHYLKDVKFKEKFNGLYYEFMSDEKIIFLKPQTYMNNSGICVRKFVDYYNILPTDILVIHDDLDLDIGRVKYKLDSSSGGHNGIKSIINSLGTKQFNRLKIGISSVDKQQIVDYVLGKFSNSELEKINFDEIDKSINDFISNDFNYVMNKYNRK